MDDFLIFFLILCASNKISGVFRGTKGCMGVVNGTLLVDFANKTKNPWLLEADFVIQSNDQFHKISERIKEEIGTLDSKRILFDWNEWLKRHVKKMDFHSKM